MQSSIGPRMLTVSQQATGNRMKCLLEIYKERVQFVMRLLLLVNERLQHKDIICCAKIFLKPACLLALMPSPSAQTAIL